MSGKTRLLPRAASVLCAALAIAGFILAAGAQTPTQTSAVVPTPPVQAPLVYRRIYVPADELATQIRGLLPMKRAEFDQRLQAALKKSQRAAGPPAVWIDAATFRARFDGTALVEGQAELNVVATTDEPTLLPLEPCNIALQSAAWRRTGEEAAVIGADPEGNLQCLVEGSGKLALAWSCPAATGTLGETLASLQLPPSSSRRLEIAVPAALDLAVSGGLARAGKPTLRAGGERLWTVDLDGSGEVKLRFSPREAEGDSPPLMTVRESTAYSVFRSQVDCESTFLVDVLQRTAAEIQLHCDSSLVITDVRLGDESLPFSIDERPVRGPAKVHVSLPAPLAGLNQSLSVLGSASWPESGAWNLPRVRVVGAIYQEGQAEITAPPWLRLDVRPLRHCATTLVTPAAAGRTQEKFSLRLYAADSVMAIRAAPMPAPLREESGQQIVVESNQVNGVLVAELTSLAGSQFEVQARIPRQWIVDAVETEPPEVLADRLLDARTTGPQALRLRLNRPITASRPLRLVIRAHYRRPANGQPLGESVFRLATFPDARDWRRLLAVRVADPAAELRLGGGDHLERLDPAQLSPADARLFESPPGGMVFLPSAGAERFAAVLQPTTARYRADVAVKAEIDGASLRGTVRVHCEPEGPAVATVAVRLAPRPGGPIVWRLIGAEDRELPATVEASPPAGGAADEVVYRLALPRPQTGVFEITGQWTDAAFETTAGKSDLPLAWAPEAVAQTGAIEVYSPAANLLVEASDAEPLPRPAAIDRSSAELRARYRYALGRQPRVAVRSQPGHRGEHGAWVEHLDLISRFGVDGFGEHEAILAVRNAGVSTLVVRLPANTADVELVSHEATIDEASSGQEETRISFRLRPAERQCLVKFRYTSHGRPLGAWPVATLTAPIPQPLAAVLDRSWTVSLPPELAADAQGAVAAQSAESASAGDRSYAGWSTVRASLPAQGEAALCVHRPFVVRLWAACVGLVACVMSAGRSRWARSMGPLSALAAAAALNFLGPLGWLFAALACGSLAGNTIGLLRGVISEPREPAGESPSRTSVLADGGSAMGGSAAVGGSAAGALIFFFVLAQALRAAPPGAATSSAGPTYRVVIPVDSEQEPSGDYVYLEPALYDVLQLATQETTRAAAPWLVERARFDLSGVTPGAAIGVESRSAIGEMLVTLDFHLFAAGETVSLPFSRSEVLLLENRARLDGRPISLAWRGDGAALLVPVESAGNHRLELALGALSKSKLGALSLDIAAPPAAMRSIIAASALPIHAPAAVEKPAGAPTRDFALARSPRLTVHWPSPEDAALSAAMLEADQLLWWKIRPGSVTVQGRFRLRPLPGPVQEAVVPFDPRLRLLPGLASGPIARLAVEEGTPSRVRVWFDGSAGEPTFQLAWLWPDASGSGTLVLPRIAVEADRLLRNWVGISAESQLTFEKRPPETHTTSLDFARAWGEGAAVPLALFEPHGDQVVQLALHHSETTPAIDQATQWSISSTAAHAVIRATLKDVSPLCWAHRVKMPPQLRLRGVTLMQADRPAAHRWSQSSDGTLVITLLEPPAAEQTLQISAEMPLRSLASLSLPLIEASDTRPGQSAVEVYRQSDVLVTVPPVPSWTAADRTLGEYTAGLGRLVASLRADSDSDSDAKRSPIKIEIAANKPRLSGQMLIRAAQADGDWRGEAYLRLKVAGGLLDELRLSIPERWADPLEVEPPMPERRETFTGESRRQLHLRPRQSISGQLNLTLRGPLHSAGGGVQAPDVAVLGDWQIERFVRLDREVAGERIDWQVAGLVLAPADFAARLPSAWRSTRGDLYRVTTPRFDATARSEQLAPAAPKVPLVDVRLAVKPGRRVVGRATFTLLPGQLRELRLSLPPGTRLVQTLIDDRAVLAVQAGLRTWTIAAPSPRLACLVTVLYDAALPLDGSAGEAAAPQLEGLTAERSLWSLDADSLAARLLPPLRAHGRAGEKPLASFATSEDSGLLRLEAAVEALESVVSAQSSDLPVADLHESFRRRQVEYERCRQSLVAPLESPSAAGDHKEQFEAATQRAERVRQRLNLSDVSADESASGVTQSERPGTQSPDEQRPGEPPTEALLPDASPFEASQPVAAQLGAALVAPGMPDSVRLEIDPASLPGEPARRAWSLAMLGLAAVGLVVLRLRRAP